MTYGYDEVLLIKTIVELEKWFVHCVHIFIILLIERDKLFCFVLFLNLLRCFSKRFFKNKFDLVDVIFFFSKQ